MKNKKILAISFVLICVLLAALFFKNQPEYISKAQFLRLNKEGLIKNVLIGDDFLTLKTTQGSFLIAKEAINLKDLGLDVITQPKSDQMGLIYLGCGVFLIFLILLFSRKNKKQGKAKQASLMNEKNPSLEFTPVISKLGFKDVAGAKLLKEELYELVDFLKNPKKYQDFGIKMPKGVLMIGPPGVGKTLVAKAVAGEAGVPFFYQSGASFVEIYVGMGAKRVKELFLKAKSMAPSIIFIDEIDAVGKERGGLANTERDSTLNQLLTQMDGFEDNSGVMVIAATNKIELLDEALLRAGRFDRRVFLSLPDISDRLEILKIYMADKKGEVDLPRLAKRCVGFSAASLETLVNEAAINALRQGSKSLSMKDFDDVMAKVLYGKKNPFSLDAKEKQVQAVYQAAKALCAYYFDIEFERFTLSEDRLSEAEATIKSRSQLLFKLKFYLCGMEATKEYFKEGFTNASEDLLKAKELVKYMQGFEMLSPNDLAEQKAELRSFLKVQSPAIKALAKLMEEQEKLEYKEVKQILKEI